MWWLSHLHWKLYIVLSQICIASGILSREYLAKKQHAGEIGSPYKIIQETRSALDAFAKCLKDSDGDCSSFSFDQSNKRASLYSTSTRNKGDYVIMPTGRCPFESGCLYSNEFDYVLYVNEQGKKSWNDASAECISSGGNLVSLDPDAKFASVKYLLEERPDTYWLGGRWISGMYRWMNGRKLSSSFWHAGQPSGNREYLTTGRWYFGSFGLDDTISDNLYFICEY